VAGRAEGFRQVEKSILDKTDRLKTCNKTVEWTEYIAHALETTKHMASGDGQYPYNHYATGISKRTLVKPCVDNRVCCIIPVLLCEI
jgi:hypothetical protein